jgi:hypothetical protein
MLEVKSCQENELILTGLGADGEKLSEISRSSDRFGVQRRKALGSKPEFGQV